MPSATRTTKTNKADHRAHRRPRRESTASVMCSILTIMQRNERNFSSCVSRQVASIRIRSGSVLTICSRSCIISSRWRVVYRSSTSGTLIRKVLKMNERNLLSCANRQVAPIAIRSALVLNICSRSCIIGSRWRSVYCSLTSGTLVRTILKMNMRNLLRCTNRQVALTGSRSAGLTSALDQTLPEAD